jgi:hypothetical protein
MDEDTRRRQLYGLLGAADIIVSLVTRGHTTPARCIELLREEIMENFGDRPLHCLRNLEQEGK